MQIFIGMQIIHFSVPSSHAPSATSFQDVSVIPCLTQTDPFFWGTSPAGTNPEVGTCSGQMDRAADVVSACSGLRLGDWARGPSYQFRLPSLDLPWFWWLEKVPKIKCGPEYGDTSGKKESKTTCLTNPSIKSFSSSSSRSTMAKWLERNNPVEMPQQLSAMDPNKERNARSSFAT